MMEVRTERVLPGVLEAEKGIALQHLWCGSDICNACVADMHVTAAWGLDEGKDVQSQLQVADVEMAAPSAFAGCKAKRARGMSSQVSARTCKVE